MTAPSAKEGERAQEVERAPEVAAAESAAAPISVRLGTVVPPEDPEDWTKPLTWLAAAGMLVAPLLALLWFWLLPPASAGPNAGTWLLSSAVVVGGVLTGTTQRGTGRAAAATLGAALFATLGVVVVGSLTAGAGWQLATSSPRPAHAFLGSLAGLAGIVAAAPLIGIFASRPRRGALTVAAAAIGMAVAALVLAALA